MRIFARSYRVIKEYQLNPRVTGILSSDQMVRASNIRFTLVNYDTPGPTSVTIEYDSEMKVYLVKLMEDNIIKTVRFAVDKQIVAWKAFENLAKQKFNVPIPDHIYVDFKMQAMILDGSK